MRFLRRYLLIWTCLILSTGLSSGQVSKIAPDLLNLISGLSLFASDAQHFWHSYTFRVKIVLIILGGINAAILGQAVFQPQPAGAPQIVPTGPAKLIAGTSLVFWFGAICAGRLIAYLP